MQLFIWMLFLVVGAYAKDHPIPICKEHEHYNKCGTDCPITCANLHDPPPEVCDDVCLRGCECDKDYYRQYGKYVGDCVRAEDCPSKEGYTILVSSYKSFDSESADSEFIIPTPASVQEAPAPTVPVKEDSPPTDPVKTDSTPTDPVKPDSTYSNATKADSALAATSVQKLSDACFQPRPICEKAILRYGYFYNPFSVKCERFKYGSCTGSSNNFRTKRECELACIDAGPCPVPNSEFTRCGAGCPETCENYNKPRMCTFNCVMGCICIEPYISDGNHCVLPSDCPISV